MLVPPPSQAPGDSLNFPDTAAGPPSFQPIHDLVTGNAAGVPAPNCAGCHSSEAGTPIQPYFADPDINVAYDAAKSKIDLDDPVCTSIAVTQESDGYGSTECNDGVDNDSDGDVDSADVKCADASDDSESG